MASQRSEYVFHAKLAEQAERYDEMARAIKQVTELHDDLSVDERNILSCAFKNVLAPKRSALRFLASVYEKERSDHMGETKLNACKSFYDKVEQELMKVCDDVVAMLETDLIPHAKSPNSLVYYLKMEGDFYRYKAEALSGSMREQEAAKSLKVYERALDLSHSLPTTDPIRLGLALNFSVFYFEILDKKSLAIDLAKTTLNDAVVDLDTLTEDSYKDSAAILHLLRDNIALWRDEETSDDEDTQLNVDTESPIGKGKAGDTADILNRMQENIALWK